MWWFFLEWAAIHLPLRISISIIIIVRCHVFVVVVE